jgi:hypothetical protein
MSTTYYINGTNFSTATSVFTDAELTTCAPDGYYRLGGITRQQVNCQLLEQQDCGVCGVVSCDSEVIKTTQLGDNASSRSFITEFDLTAPSTTGAVVVVIKLVTPIKFSTKEIPTAIQLEYDGNNYSKLVRKVGDTNIVGNATVNSVGYANPSSGDSDFILVGGDDLFALGTKSYYFYRYDGSSYVSTGFGDDYNIQIYNQAQEDSATTSNNGPEYVVLVMPKLTANNQLIVNILQQNISDTNTGQQKLGFGFKMYVHCPTVLSPTNTLYGSGGNLPSPTAIDACASTDALTINFYAVGSGTGLNTNTSLTTLNPTQPQLRDVLFADPYGNTQLPSTFDGWYRVDTGNPATAYAIRLEDGIVAEIYSCAP